MVIQEAHLGTEVDGKAVVLDILEDVGWVEKEHIAEQGTSTTLPLGILVDDSAISPPSTTHIGLYLVWSYAYSTLVQAHIECCDADQKLSLNTERHILVYTERGAEVYIGIGIKLARRSTQVVGSITQGLNRLKEVH